MIHKRPFIDEGTDEVAFKHPRHWENTNHLSLSEIAPVSDIHQKPCASGDENFGKSQVGGNIVDDSVNELLNGTDEELETGTSRRSSHFWWGDSNVIHEDSETDAGVHLSFFPEYFAPANQLRALSHSDEIYSSLLDSPSPRLVPVGSEHQADIPEWDPLGVNSSADCLDGLDCEVVQSLKSGFMAEKRNDTKLIGICVIPMPGLEVSANLEREENKTNCKCLDQGSIRCVQQHVMEARESLRIELGQETFEKLGFGDMGEGVAWEWTKEEELNFHTVVLSNPVTLGKNFWNNLSEVFPGRTKRDFVSYYFNVFMLRKRAEQNRFDPLNIDSDNDEWQITEDRVAEDEEDSVVDCLTSQDGPACYRKERTEDCLEDIENGGKVDVHQGEVETGICCRFTTDEEDEGDVDDISGAPVKSVIADGTGDINYKVLGKTQRNASDDNDFQDESCTSYECQEEKFDCCVPPYMCTDTREPSEL